MLPSRRLPARALATGFTAAALALALAGCSSADAPAPQAAETESGTELTVFAAASLTGTFTELAEQFEAEHEGVTVTLNFGGSSGLVTQLVEGAKADVFASADEANMAAAREQDLVTAAPALFATNTLEIAVPPDNPAGITAFADLADPALRLVVCAPQVPCGAATEAVAEQAGVTLTPVSEESAVTDVLGKVISGEADAGLVYRTDVIAAGDSVLGIEFPESELVVNAYPIAPLSDAPDPELAQQFVDFVTGPTGSRVLTDAGFGTP